MNNRKTITVLFISIIIFLITIVLLFLFIKIIKNKNIHTGAVLSSLESKIKEKENFSELESEVKNIKDTAGKINGYFIDVNQADLFVDYLEELGSNAGSKLTVKNIETQENGKNFIFIKVSVGGGFSEVINTISLLENIPLSVSMKSIYINKEKNSINVEKTENPVFDWTAEVSFSILSSN